MISLGLEKDAVVIVQLPNSVELVLLRVACEKAGLLCLPVLPNYRHSELQRIIQYTGAAVCIIPWHFKNFDYYQMLLDISKDSGLPKHIIVSGAEVPERALALNSRSNSPVESKFPINYLENRKCKADEFSLINMTSGTTGEPKFVEQPMYSRVYAGKIFGLRSGDIVAILSPAAGGPNISAYFGAPQLALKTVLLESFEAEAALRLMEKEKVTFIGIVPAQLSMLANHPNVEKFNLKLRVIVCTGAPLPYAVGVLGESSLKAPVCQNYGSMDSGGVAMTEPEDSQDVRLITAGRPIPGNEIKLLDDSGKDVTGTGIGEVLTRGPMAVSGYYKDPVTTSSLWDKDGWFRLGDLGKFDEKGNLVIVGRKKDMIIRGGQNVFPVEIENLLLTNSKISNAAVVAMPDPVMGEKACAYIVLKEGQSMDFEEMVSFLRGKKIAAYKLPERLEIIEALPMVAAGQKIDKKALQKDVEQKLQRESKI